MPGQIEAYFSGSEDPDHTIYILQQESLVALSSGNQRISEFWIRWLSFVNLHIPVSISYLVEDSAEGLSVRESKMYLDSSLVRRRLPEGRVFSRYYEISREFLMKPADKISFVEGRQNGERVRHVIVAR